MSLVVIFRASDRPEVGSVAHQPAEELSGPSLGQTVLRTLCGQVNVGRVFERDHGVTCAFCQALSGRHPGGHGKRFLARWHRARQARPT